GGRFFAATGVTINGYSSIEDRQAELDTWYGKNFLSDTGLPSARAFRPTKTPASYSLSDGQVIDRARRAGNGAKFEALFAGDWTGSYKSQSEADLALTNILAFFAGNDV